MSEESLICSFCSKSRKNVAKMIVGATKVAICNECIKLCVEILDEDVEILLSYEDNGDIYNYEFSYSRNIIFENEFSE